PRHAKYMTLWSGRHGLICGRRVRASKAARHDGFSLRRRLRFRIIQKISPALIGKIFQTDSAATESAESAALCVGGEALFKVFKRIKLACVGLHFGGDVRVILLRDRAELVPIEPFFGDVADVTQIARAQ